MISKDLEAPDSDAQVYAGGPMTSDGILYMGKIDCTATPVSKITVAYSTTHKEAIRHDDGKPKVSLIPPEVLLELAKLYTEGAKQYDEDNWRKGMAWSRCYNSLQRHLLAWWSGEEKDVSGFSHLTHVVWNAVALLYYSMHPRYKDQDDRFKLSE